ncbi:hypothetical protein ACMZOO_00860 [Catenovulum sp. SX2]|uniref:hypothetical protein n=1 Tax=Catenovulum sp. SX2 TaxID=3398614 RepID=UPI003F82E555
MFESIGKPSQFIVNAIFVVGVLAFVWALSTGNRIVIADKEFGVIVQEEVKKLVHIGSSLCSSQKKYADGTRTLLETIEVNYPEMDLDNQKPSIILTQTHAEILSTNEEYAFEVDEKSISSNGFSVQLYGADKTILGDCAFQWIVFHPDLADQQVLPKTRMD